MKLREYQREKFNRYLHHLYKGDKCEICGSVENIEVHHDKLFSDLLYETLEILKLTEKDTNEYSKEELKIITYVMLGKQSQITYSTLCDVCHDNHHKKYKVNNFKYYYIKKEEEKNKHNKAMRDYLETNLGLTMLQVKDRHNLIQSLNLRYSNGKVMKMANNLNDELNDRGIPYRIKVFETSRMINKKQKKYRNVWRIIKV